MSAFDEKEKEDFNQQMERFYTEGWFRDVCLLCNGDLHHEGEIELYLDCFQKCPESDPKTAVKLAFLAAQESEAVLLHNPSLRHTVQRVANEQARLHPGFMKLAFTCFARYIYCPRINRPYCEDLSPFIHFSDSDSPVPKFMSIYTLRKMIDSDFVKASGITLDMLIEVERILIGYDIRGFFYQYLEERRSLPWYMAEYFESIKQPIGWYSRANFEY